MKKLVYATVLLISAASFVACTRVDRMTAPVDRASAPAAANGSVVFAPTFANLTGPVPSPAGLRACFAGESNALDVVNGNLGALAGGASYTAGRFGQAFNFTALNDGVNVPGSASLNIGAAQGLTMSAWIYGRGTMFQTGSIFGAGPIIEFDNGAHLWHHNQQHDPTGLFSNLAEGNLPAQWHIVQVPGVVSLNQWHHTAVTYSKVTGRMMLYVDGVVVGDSARGTFTANTTTTMHIGSRVTPVIGAPTFTFNGAIDEVQLYDRALTGAEVVQLASATGTMCVAPPASYAVTQLPVGSGESGVPFTTQPVVAILDAGGNVVANATTAVTASVASGPGTLLGTTTINAVNGIAAFTNLAIAGAGTTTITFTVGGGLPPAVGSPTSSGALPTVQVPRALGIVTQPGGAQTGQPLSPQPVIAVRDAAGLLVPGAAVAITATVASGTGTLSGTTTVTSSGTAAFTNLAISGAGATTLAFAGPPASGITGVTSASFNVGALAATQLSLLTAPAGAESGLPFATQPVIEIRDATGARATLATGTVTAAVTSGPNSTLIGTVTAPITNGLATFTNLQLNGPGTYALTFTSTGLTPVSAPGVVVTQVVRNVAIISGPAVVTSGQLMSPPFTVELRDAANIRVANSTYLVRMSMVTGTGTVSGTLEKNGVAGIVTFDDVVANATGVVTFSFYIVEPSAYAIAYALSGNVTALAAATAPAALAITTQPGGAESGVAFTAQPVVRAVDGSGALATTATGTVTASILSGSGALVGTATAPLVGGVATFSGLRIDGIGAHTLRFTSSAGLTAVNSSPFTVTQQVRSLAIIDGPGASITTLATITPSYVVELRDAAGLRVATSTLPVTMTLSSGTGTLTGTATRAAVAGVATFTGMSTNAVGAIKFRFTLVDPLAALPLPTVETGVVTSLFPATGTGFYLSPVDNLPAINTIEGGSKVPVKFTIGGNFGLGILWATNPITSQPASCTTFAPTGPAVPITSKLPNLGDFDYNGNKYQLTWETDKAWDGTCRILNVRLKDGSNHPAHFIIK